MSDLHDIIKRAQDELRGRQENWLDRWVDWWRDLDVTELALLAVAIPSCGLLMLIDIRMLLEMIR